MKHFYAKLDENPLVMIYRKTFYILVMLIFALAACSPPVQPIMILPTPSEDQEPEAVVDITPFPTRPAYGPGELVDYTAQAGDTLPALAARFNTSIEKIRNANQIIPEDATTMPPGMPMAIPIYSRPLWGTPHQMIPDAAFVNGPDAAQFDTAVFVAQSVGWLREFESWAFGGTRSGADIVDYIGIHYSISPKILLALLEYKSGGITEPTISPVAERNVLKIDTNRWIGVFYQLSTASDRLNDGYYRWRSGDLLEFELADGSLVRPDPWQNAATVALQFFFSQTLSASEFHYAIGPDGFSRTFADLFGDPWVTEPHIPGSLRQPDLLLPFATDKVWAFTGGPHTGWGSLAPWSALDFAPPSEVSGCVPTNVPTTAVADGVVVRDGVGTLVLDLEGDGDERTGWAIFYFHIAQDGRVPVGTHVKAGDPLGFPSCEGGRSTGTHIHIARKYNGEWMEADGVVPFVMSGWRPIRGEYAYQGWLVKEDMTVLASDNPGGRSFIPAEVE